VCYSLPCILALNSDRPVPFLSGSFRLVPTRSGRAEMRFLHPGPICGIPSSSPAFQLSTVNFQPSTSVHPALLTVQPSISPIPCKILNNLIRACYSLPCLLALSYEVFTPLALSPEGSLEVPSSSTDSVPLHSSVAPSPNSSPRFNPFVLKRLQPYLHNGRPASAFLSITSALFSS